MPTAAMQRYAAEIYRLQEHHSYAPLTTLSEQMDVSVQASSRMIRRLKDEGYLVHEPYQGVRLTPEGERIAMPALRRHRLVERFLTDIMNYGWDEAHLLADQFELGINDALEARIDALCGYPTQCPHGEPIPNSQGVMPQLNDQPLTEIENGGAGLLTRVRTHDLDQLRYFAKLGLKPGVQITFTGCGPFEGPVRITVQPHGPDPLLGYKLASALWVRV